MNAHVCAMYKASHERVHSQHYTMEHLRQHKLPVFQRDGVQAHRRRACHCLSQHMQITLADTVLDYLLIDTL